MADLDNVASALLTTLEGLDTSESIKGYKWEPGMAGFDSLPAAVVGLPSIGRTDLDEAEDSLPYRDWYLDFSVDIYIRLDHSSTAATLAIELVEAFIKAIDTEGLQAADASIMDAKVVQSEPVLDLADEAQPMLRYECSVRVWKLVDPAA